MSYISATRLPVLPAAPHAAKPAPALAATSPAKTAPAAALDLSPEAKKLLKAQPHNVPWGNSPDR